MYPRSYTAHAQMQQTRAHNPLPHDPAPVPLSPAGFASRLSYQRFDTPLTPHQSGGFPVAPKPAPEVQRLARMVPPTQGPPAPTDPVARAAWKQTYMRARMQQQQRNKSRIQTSQAGAQGVEEEEAPQVAPSVPPSRPTNLGHSRGCSTCTSKVNK